MDPENQFQSPAAVTADTSTQQTHEGATDTTGRRWYKAAFSLGLAEQGVLLVFTALLMDGGFSLRICCVASIAYWFVMLLLVWRRPVVATAIDVVFAKFGFLLCFAMTYLAAGIFVRMVLAG